MVFPKFKLEEQVDLVKILAKLGATDMFDDGKADFSNINGRRDLSISDVIHKAFIEVSLVSMLPSLLRSDPHLFLYS